MARPRREIDYDEVRRLHSEGWGSRQIAREVGASRSLVQRYLAHLDPARRTEGSPPNRPNRLETPAPAFSDSDRRHAHRLLEIGRGSASDEEFDAATKRLDELLDTQPHSTASALSSQAEREMEERIEKRESAERRAKEARDQWQEAAVADFETRWNDELRLATRRIKELKYSERAEIEEALKDEKTRAATLLVRRLKELKTGDITESLVDELVAEGFDRVGDLLDEGR
jgi:helix-turn-helix resolvase-like protein